MLKRICSGLGKALIISALASLLGYGIYILFLWNAIIGSALGALVFGLILAVLGYEKPAKQIKAKGVKRTVSPQNIQSDKRESMIRELLDRSNLNQEELIKSLEQVLRQVPA